MNEDQREGETPSSVGLRGFSLAAYRQLLRNRSYRNLMLATGTSSLGDWSGFLAIIALTTEILGPTRAAAFAVSGVMVARVLPSLLLAPVAGVFVDRWNRKRVMIASNVGRGSVMALIPFTDEVLTLLLATFVIEVMSALFAPAKDAVLPSFVQGDQLVQANQVNLLTTYGTLPLGAGLYAVLVELAAGFAPADSFLAARPLALPIWFNAATFLIAVPLLMRLRLSGEQRRSTVDPAAAPGAFEQLKEGFRFIGGHPVIRALIIGVMVAFAAAGIVITTGEFFARQLNASASGYGILVAIVGSGLVAGLVAAAPLTERVAPERLFAPGIGVAGVALIVTAAMPSIGWTILPGMIMGLGAGVSFIVGYTVLQQRADDSIRGRTFGAFNSGVRVAIFGSSVAVPFMIGVLGRETPEPVRTPQGTIEVVFPYAFGGVRITLIAGGVLAVLGAVWVGYALAGALKREVRGSPLPTLDNGPVLAVDRGLFIVFEGGDGSGKSTQIRLLRAAVERVGHLAVITREPGGTRLGERIRDLLLTPGLHDDMDLRAEALLYAAARAQHVRETIVPALERGAVVLSDRFTDSSIAYQGAGRDLGEDEVAQINGWATSGLVPDLTVLLDVDPVAGLERAVGEGDPDRLEAAGVELHRRARAAFRRRAEADPGRYLVLDATRPVEELHARIRGAVLALIEAGEAHEAARATDDAGSRDAESIDLLDAVADDRAGRPGPVERADGHP